MNSSLRLLALSALITLGLSACNSESPSTTPPAGTAAAPAEGTQAQAQQLTGAGSTFVFPVLSRWSAEHNRLTGAQVNYQSIGSGGGIAQVKAGTVDFGASDKPLSPAELAESGLVQFPLVIGGVVPVVNLEGVQPGQIRFTGPLLADIYLGKVVRWNDPKIAAINEGVALPDAEIQVVHRSDGSGTTFNFSNYLTKVSPDWAAKVGEGTSLSWPKGVGGRGNEGVAAFVQQLPNSIGYVELSYALQTGGVYGAVQNAAGNFVVPSAVSFQAAAESADWTTAQDFNLVITQPPGEQAYPIAASVFVLMPKVVKDTARQKAALEFFQWALQSGQPMAAELDYVALPEPLVQQVKAYWAAQLAFPAGG
ncbi:phosphate ABC transporter substrate-binding protein PstS [Aquimonas sp.]|jgi:phosphate transport system substrate-binding protein|uniref:phosphate ABC transporter substrate-binding protein PstS n=1 Tax=Aquimonas sp. TaxID=1872588 RepID=UPI0037BE89CB